MQEGEPLSCIPDDGYQDDVGSSSSLGSGTAPPKAEVWSKERQVVLTAGASSSDTNTAAVAAATGDPAGLAHPAALSGEAHSGASEECVARADAPEEGNAAGGASKESTSLIGGSSDSAAFTCAPSGAASFRGAASASALLFPRIAGDGERSEDLPFHDVPAPTLLGAPQAAMATYTGDASASNNNSAAPSSGGASAAPGAAAAPTPSGVPASSDASRTPYLTDTHGANVFRPDPATEGKSVMRTSESTKIVSAVDLKDLSTPHILLYARYDLSPVPGAPPPGAGRS